jgi:hypothetical protein
VFKYIPWSGVQFPPMTLPPSTYPYTPTPQPHGCGGCCRCCCRCRRQWVYVQMPQTPSTTFIIPFEEASSDDE